MPALTIADVPPALQEEIYAKLHRERMAKIGARTSAKKRKSSRANLAASLAAGKAATERRHKALIVALRNGATLTAACAQVGINYARAKAWLQATGRL